MAYNWAGNQVSLGFDQLHRERLRFKPEYLIDLFGTLLQRAKTPIFTNENIGFISGQIEQ